MSKRYKTEFPLIILGRLIQKMGWRTFDENTLKRYGFQYFDNNPWLEESEEPTVTLYFLDEQSRLDFQMRYL
jgi:hypothetical protein